MPLSTPSVVTVGTLPITEGDVTNLTADLAARTAKATLTTKGDIYAASAASTPARVGVGAAGTALVPSAGAAAGVAWGGVQVAAGVPAGAPTGLPFAYDTTPVTGGFYFWNGAAWVEITTIL